jgi:lipopolysaccharide transport system permease protein
MMDVTAPAPPPWSQRISAPLAEVAVALQNFLRHRDLLWQMVGNDLRGRYVGSLLGLFWNVVHPLVQISIYTLVFSRIMGARLPGETSPFAFSIYLCAGLLPWGVFAEIINRCTGVFWENANLVKKIAFPKVLLHTYIVTAGVTNLAIIVAVFLVFLWAVGALPPLVPLLVWGLFLLLQMLFAMGIGFFTSVLNVFFRDVAQLTAVFLQIWFWLTPIVYVANVLPPAAAELLRYNVMYHFTSVHQALVLRGQLPTLAEGLFLLEISLVTLFLGLVCFRSLRRRIPDEL